MQLAPFACRLTARYGGAKLKNRVHEARHRFCSNELRPRLSLIAYNLRNLWRRLALPAPIGKWSLTNLQQRLVKTGGRLIKHARSKSHIWRMAV